MVNTSFRGGMVSLALVMLAGASVSHGQVLCGGLLHESLEGGTVARMGRGRAVIRDLSLTRGAQISTNSLGGSGLALDMDRLLTQPGAEARVRYRGWDGMIKGTLRVASNGDNTGLISVAMDAAPVESYEVTTLDDHGNVLSVETIGGPILNKPWVPNFFCADGSTPVLVTRWVTLCNSCAPVLFIGWACANGSEHAFGNPHARMIIRPQFAPGVPVDGGVESMLVTGQGLPELIVSGQELVCGDMSLHGLGDVRLSELCTDSSGCPEASMRRRHVGSIGSSGQDGVEIRSTVTGFQTFGVEIPDIATAGSQARLDVLMQGEGQRYQSAMVLEGLGDRIRVNFPWMDEGSDVYAIDDSGTVLDHAFLPPDVPIDADINFCPPPGIPVWGMMWWNNQWVYGIYACVGASVDINFHNSDLRMSGPRIVVVPINDPPVADSMMTTITGSGLPGGITIRDMAMRSPPTCRADFNGDGFLDFFDYDDYVVAFETGLPGSDFNGDGFTDFFDYDDFVVSFETGC